MKKQKQRRWTYINLYEKKLSKSDDHFVVKYENIDIISRWVQSGGRKKYIIECLCQQTTGCL